MLSLNVPQSLVVATPTPRSGRRTKKEASPAQKGSLKSAATMPKSYPRRNAAERKKTFDFDGGYFCWNWRFSPEF
jgi:hypothetical protein